MYKHVLIATDGSEVGDKAVKQGLDVAKAFNAKVTAVKVTEMWSALDVAGKDGLVRIEAYEAAAKKAADKILAAVGEAAKAAGVTCQIVHVPDSAPAEGILATAQSRGCDLIVMGSHGRKGLNRLLLGSQAHNVLSQADISVLVCR
jgi:nucleotide-binding universal stress UspA family protein